MNTKEMIAVMQAYEDGKQIEYKKDTFPSNEWRDCNNPHWNWLKCEYRIKATNKPVNLSVLVEYLEYDYITGDITWIKKPKGSRVEIGNTAGCLDNGYIRIKIGGELIMGHRIAWALYHGEWPDDAMQIDHKNSCRSDNRIDNLRLVTNQQNAQNRSKAKGYRKRPNGKFQASIKHNGNAINLGTFDTEEEAREAYKKAKVEIHDCYPWEAANES